MEAGGVEELMPRLLPVEAAEGEAEEDWDPAAPPRTPQEYLRRVQLEAARCPEVVVAPLDPRRLRRARPPQTVSVQLRGCRPAPEGRAPTLAWQQQQVGRFSALRQALNRHKDHWRSQQLDGNVAMPKPEDEEGWKRFCLGERGCLDADPGRRPSSEHEGIDYLQIGFPPLLTIVSRMNQVTVTSVLEYLTSWLAEKAFTPELGRWLYALLACLEKPLLPEAHSLIRQLARQCSEARVLEENRNDETASALNLLICLVGRYWKNTSGWNCAETADY